MVWGKGDGNCEVERPKAARGAVWKAVSHPIREEGTPFDIAV